MSDMRKFMNIVTESAAPKEKPLDESLTVLATMSAATIVSLFLRTGFSIREVGNKARIIEMRDAYMSGKSLEWILQKYFRRPSVRTMEKVKVWLQSTGVKLRPGDERKGALDDPKPKKIHGLDKQRAAAQQAQPPAL